MPVLLFTLGVSLVVGIGLGLIPALSLAAQPLSALQERPRPGRRRRRHGCAMRNLLIVAQVAISFVLLAGAGLMLRTLWKLAQVDPGFRTERVLTSRLDLNFTRYREPTRSSATSTSGCSSGSPAEPGVAVGRARGHASR